MYMYSELQVYYLCKDKIFLFFYFLFFFYFKAHSSVEKAGLIGLVKMRFLPSDDKLSLRGSTLQAAVDEDLEAGLIPFYVRFQ